MNLELDDDQRELIEVATQVCATFGACWRTPSTHAGCHELDPGLTDALKALADVGVLGVCHPEPHGAGLGPVEAALVAKACGAALAPLPLLLWADLAGPAVPGVLEGTTSITGSFEPSHVCSFGGRTDTVVAIDHTDTAYAFESSAAAWEPVTQVDPAVPRARPRGGIPPDRQRLADAQTVRHWRRYAGLIVTAHLVGVGAAAIAAAVDYAKQRRQFGVPIGSFQAIKHLLADTHTAVQLADSQLLVAALCWAEGHPSVAEQITAAGVVAQRAAIAAAEATIQVHGGMGFTSETVPHLYYKRALLLAAELRNVGVAPRALVHRNLALHAADHVTCPQPRKA